MDLTVGRGDLRGKMTDVAVVEMVIKFSKNVQEYRERHT